MSTAISIKAVYLNTPPVKFFVRLCKFKFGSAKLVALKFGRFVKPKNGVAKNKLMHKFFCFFLRWGVAAAMSFAAPNDYQ